MKRFALFRRTSPFGLPWAGWAADLLARFGHRNDAAPVPLTFFASSRRNQPGATLIQRLNQLRQYWLNPIIQMHLPRIWLGVTDEKRSPAVFHPELRQVVRMLVGRQPSPRRQVHLHHHLRQLDRSVSRVTLIDLAWRQRLNRALRPPGQFNGMTGADTARRLSPRDITPFSSRQMVLAEMPPAALQRATRVSELPSSPLHMDMRRPDRSIAALREPPQAREASAWHQASGGAARATEPVVPLIRVEQFAGHVLKEIDRRVIARRERLGQL